ncbi:MAG: AMP-binding protein, partial [Actinomycetota bacterium]|nr:AMP-binding protein [Actinomycetota bacterium]
VWNTIAAEEVTVLVIVGDAFGRPLADALDRTPDRWDLGQLLVVVSGGATLCPTVRQDLLRHLPGTVLVDGYGTSETGGQGLMPVWPGQTGSPLPRFNVDGDTAVLDDAGHPAAPGSGVTGRLARRGRLPIGYHGDPERTANTFPVIDGVRWAIPGDLGRIEADGSVTLLGRGGSSINSGGEKVFPDEVEAVLRAHADVFDAMVVGVPNPRWGQEVTAVVVLRPDRSTDPNDLIAHCRTRLARFKAPRRVVLVPDLHRKPSGKPDIAWAEAVAARPT